MRRGTEALRIELPWPPSANSIWRRSGRRMHLSAKALRYHADVMAAVLAVRADRKLAGRICVSLAAYPPDRRKRDIDNLVKPTLDALTKAGVWLDDEQVEELTIRRLNVSRGGKLVAEIYERKAACE